ncbi:hypothetical protein TNCV_2078641 [Trichonephila clavipes]|nr:hypothetical protein TNCV_2078641 [Trichonephila clavipes]
MGVLEIAVKPQVLSCGRGREMGDPCPPPGVLPQNWGGNEPSRTVTYMVLKAMENDRRHLALCHDEFRGPRSGCRSEPKAKTDAKYYQNKVLKHLIKKSKRFSPQGNIVFHQDSAPSHTAKLTIKWLKD